MSRTVVYVLCVIIGTFLVQVHECKRYGGSGGSRSRPSHSRPSYSHPSPSYSHPSPSYSHPSPSYSHPSPSYSHPSPSYSHPSPSATARPIGFAPPPHGGSQGPQTSRPLGFDTSHNQQNHQPSAPVGHQPSAPVGHQPSAPVGPPQKNYNLGSQPQSNHPQAPAPNAGNVGWASHVTAKPATNLGSSHPNPSYPNSNPSSNGHGNIGWNIPPRPGAAGSFPQGPPRTNNAGYPTSNHQYPQHSSYPQAPHTGTTNVKIVNKYNYHYPGYYSVPVQNTYHPGYYHAPSYHYGSSDTGSGTLGFFLGYSLAKLTTPTYSHYSFYDGYRPRYDHYTVHHYYHDRDSIPQNQQIRPNSIVGCVGDTSTVCPSGTTSLCTSNGALMCVVNAASTVPCADNRQLNCVRSTVPCVNNTTPECKEAGKNSTTINIPCVSQAQLYGNLTVINNTIIIVNGTSGVNGTTAVNGTVGQNVTTTVTQDPITTVSTQYPITTTKSRRRRRDVGQNYCVAIVALPAEKKRTEGEMVFGDAKHIASKFFEKAFGL